MRVRGISDLNDLVSHDLKWRKRELTAIKTGLIDNRDYIRSSLLRAAVCILYAHWEGAIKYIATCYVNMVSRFGLKMDKLSHGFLALALREKIRELADTSKLDIHREIVSTLLSIPHIACNLNWKTAVETNANLDTDTLRGIVALIGADFAPYESKRAYIDGKGPRSGKSIDWRQLECVEEGIDRIAGL